jgi:leucyl/phenylalanyl-tRNA--protein transferase
MFYLEPNASKVAFYYFIQSLKEKGILWIDTQMTTPIIEQFGGKNISRKTFLNLLKQVTNNL